MMVLTAFCETPGCLVNYGCKITQKIPGMFHALFQNRAQLVLFPIHDNQGSYFNKKMVQIVNTFKEMSEPLEVSLPLRSSHDGAI